MMITDMPNAVTVNFKHEQQVMDLEDGEYRLEDRFGHLKDAIIKDGRVFIEQLTDLYCKKYLCKTLFTEDNYEEIPVAAQKRTFASVVFTVIKARECAPLPPSYDLTNLCVLNLLQRASDYALKNRLHLVSHEIRALEIRDGVEVFLDASYSKLLVGATQEPNAMSHLSRSGVFNWDFDSKRGHASANFKTDDLGSIIGKKVEKVTTRIFNEISPVRKKDAKAPQLTSTLMANMPGELTKKSTELLFTDGSRIVI